MSNVDHEYSDDFHERTMLAVIVGIDECGGGLPALRSGTTDAKKVAAMLGELWHSTVPRIHLLTWLEPHDAPAFGQAVSQADGILEAVFEVVDDAHETDMVLVYLRGHCIEHKGHLAFLTGGGMTGHDARLLPLQEIFEAMSDCLSPHRLLILDWPQAPLGMAKTLLEMLPASVAGWTVWLACGPEQHGLDVDAYPQRYGLFADSVVTAVTECTRSVRGTADLPSVFTGTSRLMEQAVCADTRCVPSLPLSRSQPPAPVIAVGPLAADGGFEFHLAPRPGWGRVESNPRLTPQIWRESLRFIFGPWPVRVPLVGVLLTLSGISYSLIMQASSLAIRVHPLAMDSQALAAAVFFFSCVVWRAAMAVLVASSECNYRYGPACSAVLFFVWDAAVTVVSGVTTMSVLDVCAVSFVATLYGTVPAAALITFADHVRTGKRGDLSRLVYIFSGLAYRQNKMHERSPFRLWIATPNFYIVFWLALASYLFVEWAVLQRPSHLMGWIALRNGLLAWFAFFQWIWYLCGYLVFHNMVRRR